MYIPCASFFEFLNRDPVAEDFGLKSPSSSADLILRRRGEHARVIRRSLPDCPSSGSDEHPFESAACDETQLWPMKLHVNVAQPERVCRD